MPQPRPSSLRPIVNMSRPSTFKPHSLQLKHFPVFSQSLNDALRPVLDVLRYVTTPRVGSLPALGATVSGHAHVHERILGLARQWRRLARIADPAGNAALLPWFVTRSPSIEPSDSLPQMWLFAADVERCFDSLPRAPVLRQVERVLASPVYWHVRVPVMATSSARAVLRQQPHVIASDDSGNMPPVYSGVGAGSLWARGMLGFLPLAAEPPPLSTAGATAALTATAVMARTLSGPATPARVMVPQLAAVRDPNANVRDGLTAATRLTRGALLAAVRCVVYNTVLQSGPQLLRQRCGVPQGSVISTLLACLYMGTVDNTVLLPAIARANELAASSGPVPSGPSAPAQLVMRQVDDYLVCTTSELAATAAASTLAQKLNTVAAVSIKASKSTANFTLRSTCDVGGGDVARSSDPNVGPDALWKRTDWVPWNSLMFRSMARRGPVLPCLLPARDAVAMHHYGFEVRGDYTRMMQQSARSLLLLRGDAPAGEWMRGALQRSVPPLAAQLVLWDARVNPPAVVALNAYQACAVLALRLWAMVAALSREHAAARTPSRCAARSHRTTLQVAPTHDDDLMSPHSPQFVLASAMGALDAFVIMVSNKLSRERAACGSVAAFPLTRCQLRWLGLQAFADTLVCPDAVGCVGADSGSVRDRRVPPTRLAATGTHSPGAAQLWRGLMVLASRSSVLTGGFSPESSEAFVSNNSSLPTDTSALGPAGKVRTDALARETIMSSTKRGKAVYKQAKHAAAVAAASAAASRIEQQLSVAESHQVKRARVAGAMTDDVQVGGATVQLPPVASATATRSSFTDTVPQELAWVRGLLPFLREESVTLFAASSITTDDNL